MSDFLPQLPLPYPGLRPFEEVDGPIFFGRQTQIAVLLRRLEKYRFVAIIGSSGSGKSSLVRAGLLPAIKRGFLIETAHWVPVVIRPGGDPYRMLGDELLKLRPPTDSVSAAEEFDTRFRKALRLTDAGLVKALPALGFDSKTHFLIIIDQFEELFSFRSTTPAPDDHASRDEASAFVSMLLNAFQDKNAKIWVLLTMRSDFIGNCEAFLGLPENVSKSQFLVPRLGSRQMEEAIVRPGLVTGAAFQPFTVPRELANVIINEAGDKPDQLPLMQHALMRTWKNSVALAKPLDTPILLTERDYNDAGGIKNALNQDADAAWQSLKGDRPLSEICRQMFMLLCDVLPGGRIVRRRPRVSEVMKVTGATEEQIRSILRVFQQDDRNFLLPPVHLLDQNAVLDITHEALFRQWQEIQRWIQREAESLANYQDLLAGAKRQHRQSAYRLNQLDTQRLDLWRKTEKPTEAWAERYGGQFKVAIGFLELCKRRRKYQVLAIFVIFLLAAAASTCFAWILKNKNDQLHETVRQQQRALALQQNQSSRLQNDAESSSHKNAPTSQFNALRLAAKSLRIYRGNLGSQHLLFQLMSENRWCLPATPTITSDVVVDKYILAATLLRDKKTIVVVTQEGTLLKWDGHLMHKRSLPTELQSRSGFGTARGDDPPTSRVDDPNQNPAVLSRPATSKEVLTPANGSKSGEEQADNILPKIGEAFFSDDGKYLVITPFALTARRSAITTKSETEAKVYFDPEGTGDFQPLKPLHLKGAGLALHTLSWSPKNNFLVVSTMDWQKPDQAESQLFEREGDDFQLTGLFNQLEISAACFSSDGTGMFTSTPPVKANFDTETGPVSENQPTRILKWKISHEGSKPEITRDAATLDLGNYPKPIFLSCNADGTYLAALAWGSPATIVETSTHEVKSFYLPDGGQIMRVSFSPAAENEARDLMMVATTDRIGFWKASQLKRTKAVTYALGEPWSEPIVFQGMGLATFVDNGAKVVLVSGGTFRSYESARALEIPMGQTPGAWDDGQFSTEDPAPDWLLELAAVLTGSGREPEGETDSCPTSVSDVYQQNARFGKSNHGIYQTLWDKFSPADSRKR